MVRVGGQMTNAEILQIQTMNKFFDRLCSLTDHDLMIRRQMEIEQGHSIKAINDEMNRRTREI